HLEKNVSDFCHDVKTASKPWTHLKFTAGSGDNFNFVVVGDRTGRPTYGLLEKAIDKINLLGPDFVISVGDFIESFCVEDQSKAFIQREWNNFEKILKRCAPPFFRVPGNHDIASPDHNWPGVHEMMEGLWREQFGSPYYAFIRKGILFLCLHTMECENNGISDQQVKWVLKTLKEHSDVKWTLLFMHCPNVWHTDNFHTIEAALYYRNYSVFAGDLHYYCRFRRNGRDYYMVGMTGGSTPQPAVPLRGPMFGEFQHLTWVSVRDGLPHVSLIPFEYIYEPNLVTVPKLTFLTAKYFRADQPLSKKELAKLRKQGLQVANSEFFEEITDNRFLEVRGG
ncbi:MAG: metallophosphoesterase, partial [Victivallales bacterium]|nr:metallophosphoesterase [Victivallales bacterium]